jgi:hypothetical protein
MSGTATATKINIGVQNFYSTLRYGTVTTTVCCTVQYSVRRSAGMSWHAMKPHTVQYSTVRMYHYHQRTMPINFGSFISLLPLLLLFMLLLFLVGIKSNQIKSNQNKPRSHRVLVHVLL